MVEALINRQHAIHIATSCIHTSNQPAVIHTRTNIIIHQSSHLSPLQSSDNKPDIHMQLTTQALTRDKHTLLWA